ncbi:hypothetical protein DEU35_1061 [Microbacterium sp. AG157]|nr:hypothetical protein DEU35_1061 [Microbacterium sp. AG157]
MRRALIPAGGRAPIKGAFAAVLAVTIAVILSGCFMIPLVDGRSPFDDPFGSSERDIENAISPIQAALDDSGAGGDRWHLVAESASENCEGPCNLYVAVRVEPVNVDDPDRWVPEEVLRETLIAVVPVAERQRVDVAVVSGYRKNEYGGLVSAELSTAVESLFGERVRSDEFSATSDESYGDAEVHAFTRTHTNVLASMGLG